MNSTLRPARSLSAWGVVLALFVAMPSRAQTPAAPPVTLTNLAQVRALGEVKAEELKLPVHLRGVVTYMSFRRAHFYLQDATAGMLIPVADTNLCPAFGMDVEVRGVTGRDGLYWGVIRGQFTIHGPGAMPSPVNARLAEVQAVRHARLWVEVEGVVLRAGRFRDHDVVLDLADASGVASIILPGYPGALSATNVIGARLRVQGLNVQAVLLTSAESPASVLKSGHSDIFNATPATVSALRSAAPSLDLVALRGTVLRTIRKPSLEHGIYIRDDTGAFQTVLLPRQSTNDDAYLDARPGDVVALAGSPTALQPNVFLQHGKMRLVEAGPEPEPVPATLADIVAGKFTSDLVAVRGRLLARQEVAAGRDHWRDVLRLSANGREVNVLLDSSQSGKFAALPLNDLIEARGLVVPEASAPLGSPAKKFLVQVASASDVHSLGLAPELAQRRTIQLAGGATVLALLAGSWIALLRSRLARERRVTAERERSEAAIRAANASLERRVAERTAELEQAREETARALRAEQELNALKSRFVSIVSHEFRTPLGIIMSAVELLRNYQDRLPAGKRDQLHTDIYGSTRQMAALMEQVLVLGRVEGGKLAFAAKPVDLATLCGKLADEALSATGRRCTIAVRREGSLDGAQGDEALMRHLLSNLLSNAVKYSPAGNPVEFLVRRADRNAVFIVRDHGIGIPEADVPHLFEPFRRASNVGDTPGTGLGMLIVKRCVELQNGTMGIESKVGEGTAVTVTLPLFNVRAAAG